MSNPYQDQIDQLQDAIAENQVLLEDPELSELAQKELESLNQQLTTLQEAADVFEASQDQGGATGGEPKNCTIEFRPGAGGDEAKIWANDLLRMYVRYAEQLKLKISYIDDMVIKLSGKAQWPSSAENTLEKVLEDQEVDDSADQADDIQQTNDDQQITNSNDLPTTPYQIFKNETGVHRVQRVPETESQGRVHTSTASVAVLPEVAQNTVEVRDEDLEWQFMRASGAGGQSVNKTSSAVRLIHTPTGITTTSRQEKKQEQNRKIALELLRAQLWEIEEEKRLAEIGEARSGIGRNMRAEKIRTYNYPQNRVTDHRFNQSWYSLDTIVEGGLELVLLQTLVELA